MENVMEVTIYLKSGQTVEMVVKDFKADVRVDGTLTRVEWTPAEGYKQPVYIDPRQVALIKAGKAAGL